MGACVVSYVQCWAKGLVVVVVVPWGLIHWRSPPHLLGFFFLLKTIVIYVNWRGNKALMKGFGLRTF